jgi:hypothetical protein
LESFDPRFREVYKQAAILSEPLRIRFETETKARAFVHRAHTFRKRAQLAGDSDYPIMAKLRLSVRDNWVWVIRQDSQFDDVFRQVLPSVPRPTSLKKDPLDDL